MSGGWLDQLEIRLNSALVEVEIEVEAELGKKKKGVLYNSGLEGGWVAWEVG